jgi:nucleotide-binding universal stress UspA family protein
MDAVTDHANIAAEGRSDGSGGRAARVVVGVDGSPGSRVALISAMTAAARRGAALQVVSAYHVALVWTGGSPLDTPDAELIRQGTESRARDFTDEVRRELSERGVPGVDQVEVRFAVSQGSPVQVLLREATGADLLVVGSRGRGAVRSALLGSVALHCLTHAPCPILVAHATPEGAPPDRLASPRVVVGVDGSAGSRAALAAAVDEAILRGADLDVVAAYELANYWMDLDSVLIKTIPEIRGMVQKAMEEEVAEVLAGRTGSGSVPTITTHPLEGPAADVLLEHSRGADLLVVGSQGRGALRGLLLGSVALQCAMHATSPVLVVHLGARGGSAAEDAAPATAMAGH